MPYIATNYLTNPSAPLGKWVCTRSSKNGPYTGEPPANRQSYPDYCGQCVSFVTTVCAAIPVSTNSWKKGVLVKGNTRVRAGTAIASFDGNGKYSGHAAIYESQTAAGLNVVDQWVTPPAQSIHKRVLRFGAHGNSNNGDNFYVIE